MDTSPLLAAASASSGARTTLALSLAASAALVFGYRLYRLTKGGPLADVVGGAILALLLALLSGLIATGQDWARWPALFYGAFFALVVMPVWTLAVLIPLPPRAVDYAFAGSYWISLVVVGVAAMAL